MLLTDITVEHTLVSKKDGVRQTFLLHPFTDTQRDSLGKFELVRDVWAAAGFDDTLLRWKMKPEVVHGEKKDIQPRVQARGGQAGH